MNRVDQAWKQASRHLPKSLDPAQRSLLRHMFELGIMHAVSLMDKAGTPEGTKLVLEASRHMALADE